MAEQMWAVGENAQDEILGPVPLHGWRVTVGLRLPSEIHGKITPVLLFTHRCGFNVWPGEKAYLPDVITGPVADHHRQGCSS